MESDAVDNSAMTHHDMQSYKFKLVSCPYLWVQHVSINHCSLDVVQVSVVLQGLPKQNDK